MAIPSVNLFSNNPGGAFVTGMGGGNALANAMHERKYNQARAEYAPETLLAQAASQAAYANNIAPQYLAKMLQDAGIKGNLTDSQLNAILQKVNIAGMTGNPGLNALNQMLLKSYQKMNDRPKNPISWMMDALKNKLHPESQQSNNVQMKPLQQQYVPAQSPQAQSQPRIGSAVDENGNEVNESGDTVTPVSPQEAESLERLNQGNPSTAPISMTLNTGQRGHERPLTYAEKEARYRGMQKEGEALGDIRAKDRETLNDTAFNATTYQGTLNQISDILASDSFAQIRKNPLAGHHEIAYYALEGSPEQKEMIGQYYTLTGNLIKAASRDFAGQFRKGEQQLLNGMKPGPKDTVDIAKGKTEALSVLNRMLAERSSLTSKIMAQYHVDKLKASEVADNLIDGTKIRQETHDRLYPTITLEDPNRPGITITLPILEARKRGYKDAG